MTLPRRIDHADCRHWLAMLPDNSVHSCVCDPPYELGFMGRKWDSSGIAYDVAMWREVLRVLKPGGHLLAFGGTRTYHRMTVAIEDAGFDIRDCIAWMYGSGFPKSLNVSKQFDEADTGNRKQWDGWGTALKPALEPVVVARKPLTGTVAANVLEHGTGGINVDGCRVPASESTVRPLGSVSIWGIDAGERIRGSDSGRWPANVIHDGSPEVLDAFERFGERPSTPYPEHTATGAVLPLNKRSAGGMADTGTAARFFYCAKASRAERELGCDGLPAKAGQVRNFHPTVKPIALMRYLCRLVTPPHGIVLDQFAGSGTCGMAAALEGFGYLGCELDPEHVRIARYRLAHVTGLDVEDEDQPEAEPRQLSLLGVGT